MPPMTSLVGALEECLCLATPGTTREHGEEQVKALLARCDAIERSYAENGYRGIVVLEGWDGSGKSGVVSRLQQGFSADACRIWHIKKPYDHEQQIHYLYRFWQKLPDPGTIAIFDRSWYGRVVAEPIEGRVSDDEYQRAFDEINHFEKMLTDDGVLIAKVFLHISRDEMLSRIRERLERNQAYRVTRNDFRTIENYPLYLRAFDRMIERTSSNSAPWRTIAATNRHQARVDAVSAVLDDLGRGISPPTRKVDQEVRGLIAKHFPDLGN